MPVSIHDSPYFGLFNSALEDVGVIVLGTRDRDARRLGFDVLHLHFPSHLVTQPNSFKAIFSAMSLSLFYIVTKLLKKRIVYTIHDVLPVQLHREWLVWPFIRLVHRLCDGYVFLNASSREEFYARYPDQQAKPNITIPHGPFPVPAVSGAERSQRRRLLVGEVDALLIGIFGNIKRYKGLEALKSLPSRLFSGRSVRVVVAGKIEPGYEREGNRILGGMPSRSLVRIDAKLSDRDLDEMIQAVDVVLLPYTKGWNSSAAMLVLSNKTRVLASDLPMFLELIRAVGSSWVSCYARQPERIAQSMQVALDRIDSESLSENDICELASFLENSSFSRGAARMKAFYSTLVGCG